VKKMFLSLAAALLVIVTTGCVMATTYGSASGPHGIISGLAGEIDDVSEGTQEIASYTVILGIFDINHKDYAAKVKAAEAQGKQISSKTTWYWVITKTVAYEKAK